MLARFRRSLWTRPLYPQLAARIDRRATLALFQLENRELPATGLLITEFRVRGPSPSAVDNEFIEIYNNSATPHTVAASGTGTGYGVAASDGVVRFSLPNGTVIPAFGHYLGTNSVAYSLSGYATGDATYTTAILDNAGIALFDTNVPAEFNTTTRFDAVGSTSEANTLYKEGSGYPALTPFSIDYSFYRAGSLTTGAILDTDNNATDFVFVDTNGTSAGAGQRLGAAGPQNLASPIAGTTGIGAAFLDSTVANNAAPNRVVDPTSAPPNNATFGTVSVRMTFTNNTGAPLTSLRFRLVDVTTFPSPSGTADLRISTSTATTAMVGGQPVNVGGTTLEQPPSQPNGGGFNSSVSAAGVSLATPLATGASINVQFLFGIQDAGIMRGKLVIETLPGAGTSVVDLFPANAAPTATNLNQTKMYTEGDATVALDDIVVTDPDIGDMITATLTLVNPATGSLTTSGTATYDPTTGVWMITGTVAAVNTALVAVAFTPATDNDLNTTITTRIRDSSNTGPTDGTIALNATGVNDAPTLNEIADPAPISGTAGTQMVTLTGITAGASEVQTLTVTATSSNPALIPNPIVTYTSPNNTATLTFAPVANVSGSAVITVTVMDNGGTANGGVEFVARTFTVQVPPAVAPRDTFVATTGASGGQINVFDAQTGALRTTITPYAGFTGGVTVATGDVNGDGVVDIITGAASNGHVKVFDGDSGTEIHSFFAYVGFLGGVNVAAGDVNGDGRADIITGAGPGAGPHVKVFDGATNAEVRSFFAYAGGFAGGVNVAAGDVNGDGRADIITGTATGAAHVKAFDGQTNAEVHNFFAYAGGFAGGVNVAAGDVNGDGRADIITGAGPGAGPHVKVFDGATNTEVRSFFVFLPEYTGGVRVASRNANGDMFADIVAASGEGTGADVRTFDGLTLALLDVTGSNPNFLGGIFVGG